MACRSHDILGFANMVDLKLFPVLFVDDEPQNLVVFRYALDERFTIFTAGSGGEALALLEKHRFAAILTDQRMPEMTGVELCARAHALQPDAVRILVTAYADIHAAIDAINLGKVSRYLVKPWRNEELTDVLQTAIEFFHLQQAMQEMELGLLQVGQQRIASAVHDEMLHEIANPLSAMTMTISHGSELLDDVLKRIQSKCGSDLGLVEAALLELKEVQDDALAAIGQLTAVAARMRSGYRELPPVGTCDAGTVVETTLRIVRHELERVARVRVVLEPCPRVCMDASALGQIVINLVLNAAQAIDSYGLPDRTIWVKLDASRDAARLSIVDDGPGMSEEHVVRLFSPGFTTKPKGTGLGLSIVREMVRRLGGDISVQSVLGGETCFEVRLPLA
jgi:signal transduction histidine kinase